MYYKELKDTWNLLTAPGAPFEVEEITVRGVKVRSFKNMPPSVREVWMNTAVFGNREYIIYNDERLTYAQAHMQVNAIANWLFAQGVKPGDRVAIAMRNYPEWMLIYWACVSVGITAVGMNAWWVAEELEFALNDSAPKVVFCDKERLLLLLQISEATKGIKLVATRVDAPAGVTSFKEVMGYGGSLPEVKVDPDADACIFYTSGTTGFPKGAELTHRGCVANLFTAIFLTQVQVLAAQAGTGIFADPSVPPVTPVGLVTTPLFHVTANNLAAYLVSAGGGKLILMYKWDAGAALQIIARERVTNASGVPVMAREIISHPDFANTDTSSLLSLGGGGAPLQPDLVGKISVQVKTAIPSTGYGMTEVCGVISAIGGDFLKDRPTSVGRASPAFEVRFVDDCGIDVARGEVGELWVKGAQVIKGYINRPRETAEAITDGWLHTGDMGRIDEDDFIYLVDRKKQMVLRGGENVYCAEVEACIHQHDAIAEVCVIGVPDARLGEEVGAAVVLRAGFKVSADELRKHCESHIARYKIPRYIWILNEPLPRNASGKFIKRQLQQTLKIEDAS